MFNDLDLPAQRRLDPRAFAFLLVSTLGPDQFQTRKNPFERRKEEFAAARVLDGGCMDEDVQDQPKGIDQQMALAAFHLFSAIRAARPPFCVV
jgi:hypothetical protein